MGCENADRIVGVHRELSGVSDAARFEMVQRALPLSVQVADPQVSTYRHATIVAVVKQPLTIESRLRPSSEIPSQYVAGVVVGEGVPVPESRVLRGPEQQCICGPKAPSDTRGKAVGPGVYGGFVFRHFGHLLLEGISRLWGAALTTSELPIYVQASKGRLTETASRLVEYAGLSSRVKVLSHSVVCSELLVPSPSFVVRVRAHRAHRELCQRIADACLSGEPVDVTDQPVYLSRSKLPDSKRAIVGEAQLERVLAERGVRIVHAEELSIEEQIRVVNEHRNIIAPLGSSLHLLLFSRQINSVVAWVSGPPNPSFLLCDAINGTRASYHSVTSRSMLVEHPVLRVFEYPERLNVREALRVLRDKGWIPDGDEPRVDERALETEYREQTCRRLLHDLKQWQSRELAGQLCPAAERLLGAGHPHVQAIRELTRSLPSKDLSPRAVLRVNATGGSHESVGSPRSGGP